jgi:hypothetical protein
LEDRTVIGKKEAVLSPNSARLLLVLAPLINGTVATYVAWHLAQPLGRAIVLGLCVAFGCFGCVIVYRQVCGRFPMFFAAFASFPAANVARDVEPSRPLSDLISVVMAVQIPMVLFATLYALGVRLLVGRPLILADSTMADAELDLRQPIDAGGDRA